MKLQINDNGAWRNVLSFPCERDVLLAVGDAAVALCSAARSQGNLRILDDQHEVLGYCDGPEFREWVNPAWSKR